MRVAVIGGGAAGFFAAIAVKENYPSAQVVIFEKTKTPLAKVKVSGGGRCNVTNGCNIVSELCKAYPRGGKKLKKALHLFNTSDAIRWFENRGVPLVTQSDNCVFPASQDSQSIINCFLKECKRLKININLDAGVKAILKINEQFKLNFTNEAIKPQSFDKVIVTTGGSPKRSGLEWLEKLGHKIEQPVPSLFTFKTPNNPLTKLMGIVVENVQTSIQGTKFKADGPLLITHWGMSGPAILKLSSFGARYVNEQDYHFKIQVNWINENNAEHILETLINIAKEHPHKILANYRPYAITERMWLFLLDKCGIVPTKNWNEIGKKGFNKLVNILANDEYTVNGKTTFRDEFVTCGGVSLDSIHMSTMESKIHKGLYFAGEVLDIDAITGGYNLQAAWTTGYIAGKLEHKD